MTTHATTFSTRRKVSMFGRRDRPSIMATGPTGRIMELVQEGGCWHLIQRTSPAEADSFPIALRAQLFDWLGCYKTLTAAKAAAAKWLEARGS